MPRHWLKNQAEELMGTPFDCQPLWCHCLRQRPRNFTSRREMSMSKTLSRYALLALALMSAGAQAGTTQSNLVIKKLQPEGNGILIGFATLPTDCTTSYKGGHAFLGTSIKDFDSLYLVLSTAMV